MPLVHKFCPDCENHTWIAETERHCGVCNAGLLSPELSPSGETPRTTPSRLPISARKSLNFDDFEAWCRSLTGMQLWECSRIAQMVMLSHMPGATGMPDTHTRKHRADLPGPYNLAQQPAKSSRKSTPRAVKGVVSQDKSLPQFNSLVEGSRYAVWIQIQRANRTDCQDNREYWMSRWGSKGFQSCPETSAGTGEASRS